MATVNLNRTSSMVGLGDHGLIIPSSGIYFIDVAITEPISSGMTILVKNGSTTILTLPVLAGSETGIHARVATRCVTSDSVFVRLSGSGSGANQLNTVKTTITIGEGY